jgi:hypothetical protein
MSYVEFDKIWLVFGACSSAIPVSRCCLFD